MYPCEGGREWRALSSHSSSPTVRSDSARQVGKGCCGGWFGEELDLASFGQIVDVAEESAEIVEDRAGPVVRGGADPVLTIRKVPAGVLGGATGDRPLDGAVLAGQHDEWQVTDRRYLSEASMALTDTIDQTDPTKEVTTSNQTALPAAS